MQIESLIKKQTEKSAEYARDNTLLFHLIVKINQEKLNQQNYVLNSSAKARPCNKCFFIRRLVESIFALLNCSESKRDTPFIVFIITELAFNFIFKVNNIKILTRIASALGCLLLLSC